MARVRAISFDLDDTLTDWWTGITLAAAAVRAPEICDRVREATWIRRDGVVVDRHHWRVLHEPATFMAAALVEPFLAALDPPLFDDVVPALEALRGRLKLALLTNNPYGADVLDRHGLHVDVFDSVVVADPSVRKPNPRAFAPLLDALALAANEIAHVGDSVPADVEGAIGAGLHSVWLNRWNDPFPVPPGVFAVTSLSELHDLSGLHGRC
ncbi:MAG TPA: HAD family hydrolase [Acidimicrobiia bacterium]|nr:HAD family hydrolase [Acidimicrobiia bacterium]